MLLAVCGGKQPGNVEHLENRTVATIAQVPSKASLFAVKGSDVEGNVILQGEAWRLGTVLENMLNLVACQLPALS